MFSVLPLKERRGRCKPDSYNSTYWTNCAIRQLSAVSEAQSEASGHKTPLPRLAEMVQNRVEEQKRVEKPGLRQPIAGYMGHVPGAFPLSPRASGFMLLLFPMEYLHVLHCIHAQICHKGMVALGLHGANWRDLCKQDPKLNPGLRTLKSDDISRPQTGALQISKRGHASSML